MTTLSHLPPSDRSLLSLFQHALAPTPTAYFTLSPAPPLQQGAEPDFTNFARTKNQPEPFVGCLDYIFLGGGAWGVMQARPSPPVPRISPLPGAPAHPLQHPRPGSARAVTGEAARPPQPRQGAVVSQCRGAVGPRLALGRPRAAIRGGAGVSRVRWLVSTFVLAHLSGVAQQCTVCTHRQRTSACAGPGRGAGRAAQVADSSSGGVRLDQP